MTIHTSTALESLLRLLPGADARRETLVVLQGYCAERCSTLDLHQTFDATSNSWILTAFEKFPLRSRPLARFTETDTWINPEAQKRITAAALEAETPTLRSVGDQQEQAAAVAELACFTDGG